MLFLYFKAPFGAFKPFQSVEMLATVEFMTYSAAYGFLLGIAGINSRDPLVKLAYANTKIALGTFNLPRKGRVLQQLHKGIPGDKDAERAKGRKPKIDIYWRELLYSNLEGYIGLDSPKLEPLVIQGIENPKALDYWGLPFMGDNNFFVERLNMVSDIDIDKTKCQWFTPSNPNNSHHGQRLYYFSVWTDYQDSRNSKSLLFMLAPFEEANLLNLDSDVWIPIVP